MGQGARTTPFHAKVEKPFYWDAPPSTAGKKVVMTISLLPILESSNGLQTGQNVYINATVLEWYDKTLLTTPPTQPSAAVAPNNKGTWLKPTTIALTVASSLYLSLF